MNKYLLVISLLVTGWQGMGQQYQQSAGVRLGSTSGLTFKKFLVEDEAVEFMASGRQNGIQLTMTYLFHEPMEFSFNENFYAIYGAGGHVGFEERNNFNKVLIAVDPPDFEYEEKGYFTMGMDGVLGIEFRWLKIPATLGGDIKPYFNFVGLRHLDARFWDWSLSFKYIF
ncbi:MAG: hypothetical protein JXQ90_11040 [Cyclobacteriaceae bacterium]